MEFLESTIHLKGRAVSYHEGDVHFVDMTNIQFINSSDIAELITLVKGSLSQGIEVKLLNVCDNVKKFIEKLELENILTCV